MTHKRRDSILGLTVICPAGASFPSAGKCLCTVKISAFAQINKVRSEEMMTMFSFPVQFAHVNFLVIYGQTCASRYFLQEPVRLQPLHKPFAINCIIKGLFLK